MGADNQAPGERLEQGAKLGNESELAPGWELDEKGQPKYDPEKRKAGAIDPPPEKPPQ